MIIDDLIYTRVQDDVDTILSIREKILADGYASLTTAQKNAWSSGLGAYRHTDLNRVGEAVDYIATEMIAAITTINSYLAAKDVAPADIYLLPWVAGDIVVTAKQNWAINNLPTKSQIDAYVADYTLIATELSMTQYPEDVEHLTFTGANEIEKMLFDAYYALLDLIAYKESLIDKAAASYLYSGEIYCGE